MTQEQKAKAYDEALERAKKILCNINEYSDSCKDIETIFPELAESEDERIRERLIDAIKIGRSNGISFTEEAANGYIAWLKKQKINAEGDFARGYDCGYECCLNSHGAEWFEKQKEQSITANDLDEEIHRFFEECINVHEAKLYGNISEMVIPVVCYEATARHFAKWGETQKENPQSADSVPSDCASNAKCEDRSPKHSDSDGIDISYTPAYWRGWDDAMKQKEQKPVDLVAELKLHLANTPKEQLEKEWKELEPYGNIGPTVHEFLYGEQPAEWNEEDEDMLNCCISSIEEAKENRYYYRETDGDTSYDHEISWLKSLRPRPHWTPSEEHLSALLAIINDPNNIWSQTCQLALSDLYEQLKWLKKIEDNANKDNT